MRAVASTVAVAVEVGGHSPIMNVMRCGPTRIVNIERCLARRPSIIPTGPLMKSSRWPRTGTPPVTSGGGSGGCAGSFFGAPMSSAWRSAAVARTRAGAASAGLLIASAAKKTEKACSAGTRRGAAPARAPTAQSAAWSPLAPARGAKPRKRSAFVAVK